MLFSFEVLGKGDLIADFKKKFVTFLFENEIQFHQIYVESDRSGNNWEIWFPLLIYADLDRKKHDCAH